MVECESLTRYYGPNVGVEDLTFTVRKGEVLGLLGPNGAGKTTAMRLLTGYLAPSSGTARVAGYDVMEDPLGARRHIGYLPEDPPLYPDMTVRSYLDFVARIKEVSPRRRRSRISDVVDRLEIGPVADRLVQNISRGYRQRVGLAQALVHDPDVLVLDEPTSGLDPRQIIGIRELIRELGRDHAVILSSHILPEVSMVCGRIAILQRGKVVAFDTQEGISARVRGSRFVHVLVKGPADEVKRRIERLDGVGSVEGTDRFVPTMLPDGACAWEVRADGDVDVRETLFEAMSDAGFPILEMTSADPSLEEAFLELTTEEVLET